MRIAIIYLGRHGPGGVSTLELATHLARKADVFAVVSTNADHIDAWRASGVPLIETPTFDSGLQAATSLFAAARLDSLALRIGTARPDVVLYYMVHPWTPLLQERLRGIPHVVTVHDPSPHPGFFHAASSVWETVAASGAARCVVLSRMFVSEMRARGIAPDRIDVIPHPVFALYDQHAEVVLPAKDRSPSLLFFGRITGYKGLEVLIQAFRFLLGAWPGLRLNIVGEGDIRPYARLLATTPNITVVNRWVDDREVAGFFGGADIVVLPYTSASQSGVAVLAACFARAVVATRVGALPEQIRDGETGLLVEPGSVESLSRGIERLLRDEPLRHRLALNLSAAVRKASNWETVSAAYLESCRKAIAQP